MREFLQNPLAGGTALSLYGATCLYAWLNLGSSGALYTFFALPIAALLLPYLGIRYLLGWVAPTPKDSGSRQRAASDATISVGAWFIAGVVLIVRHLFAGLAPLAMKGPSPRTDGDAWLGPLAVACCCVSGWAALSAARAARGQ